MERLSNNVYSKKYFRKNFLELKNFDFKKLDTFVNGDLLSKFTKSKNNFVLIQDFEKMNFGVNQKVNLEIKMIHNLENFVNKDELFKKKNFIEFVGNGINDKKINFQKKFIEKNNNGKIEKKIIKKKINKEKLEKKIKRKIFMLKKYLKNLFKMKLKKNSFKSLLLYIFSKYFFLFYYFFMFIFSFMSLFINTFRLIFYFVKNLVKFCSYVIFKIYFL